MQIWDRVNCNEQGLPKILVVYHALDRVGGLH